MSAAPAANGAAAGHSGADFGFLQALKEGGVIAWITLAVLVIMSVGSWYIFFVKLIDQNRIIKEGRRARTTFWQSPNMRDAANKLDKNGAYRQIVEDGLLAEEQHNKLTDPIDQHDWMLNSLARSQGAITAKLSGGLAQVRGLPERGSGSTTLLDDLLLVDQLDEEDVPGADRHEDERAERRPGDHAALFEGFHEAEAGAACWSRAGSCCVCCCH